jgi:hypothetical protein
MIPSRHKDREHAVQELLKQAQVLRLENKLSGKKPHVIVEPKGSMGKVLSQDKFKVGPKLDELLNQEPPSKTEFS